MWSDRQPRGSALIMSMIGLVLPAPLSADGNHAPVVRDPLRVCSMARPSDVFRVSTTIVLVADDPDTPSDFIKITYTKPVHGEVKDACGTSPSDPCNPANADAKKAQGNPQTQAKDKSLSLPGRQIKECRYEPDPGFTGEDSFVYTASDGVAYTSGTVLITVEPGGLRWEIETSGSTGLSDDNATVLGKTGLDVMFRLDWQALAPRKRVKGTDKEDRPKDKTIKRIFQLEQPVELGSSRLTRGAHVAFRTGFVSRPLAVKQTPSQTGNERVGADSQDSPQSNITYERAFTVGGELNISGVGMADAHGSYFEFGGLLKGHLDAFLDSKNIIEKDGVTFVRLEAPQKAFYDVEAGARFALKRMGERSDSVMVDNRSVESSWSAIPYANLEDLLVVEALYQRSEALKGLIEQANGDSSNRWVIRFLGMPDIPNSGRKARFLLGMEMSRGISGGPQDVRIFYGVNVNVQRLF